MEPDILLDDSGSLAVMFPPPPSQSPVTLPRPLSASASPMLPLHGLHHPVPMAGSLGGAFILSLGEVPNWPQDLVDIIRDQSSAMHLSSPVLFVVACSSNDSVRSHSSRPKNSFSDRISKVSGSRSKGS